MLIDRGIATKRVRQNDVKKAFSHVLSVRSGESNAIKYILWRYNKVHSYGAGNQRKFVPRPNGLK